MSTPEEVDESKEGGEVVGEEDDEDEEEDRDPELDVEDKAFLAKFNFAPSKTKLIGHMLKHLKIFLLTQSPPVSLASFSEAHVRDQLVTKWANYLGKDAVRQDRTRKPIKVLTALSYLSAFKQFVICLVGKDNSLPKCLDDKTFSTYSAAIWTAKRAMSKGVPLVTPKESATEDDRRALAALCIWNADCESAEFLVFLIAAYQSAGRGGEMAALTWANLLTTTIKEQHSNPYSVLQLDFFRDKTSTQNAYCIFPDRDSVLNDFAFILSYFLTLSKHSTDKLLPNFNVKLSVDKNGKTDSTKVSSCFTALIMKLFKLADEYLQCEDEDDKMDSYQFDKLNKNIRSHAGRKSTMNVLAESAVPYYVWVHRTGLLVRNITTLFDYLTQSLRTDIASGKTLAGWTYSLQNEIYGGVPPTLNCLDNPAEAKNAACILFGHHIAHGLNVEVAYLLFASVLLNIDKFQAVVKDEPRNKFANQKHPFVSSVESALKNANITDSKYESWKIKIASDYCSKNVLGLPFQELPVDVQGNLLIDCRSFFEMLHTVTHLQMRTVAGNAILASKSDSLSKQISSGIDGVHQKLDMIYAEIKNASSQSNTINGSSDTAQSLHFSSSPTISAVVTESNNEGYTWRNFYQNFQDTNMSLSDKFVMFHASDPTFEKIFKARLDKSDYSRTCAAKIRRIITGFEDILNETPVPRETLEYGEWVLQLRAQGKRAEDLILSNSTIVEKMKDTIDLSPCLTHLDDLFKRLKGDSAKRARGGAD
jgi:hypothetical protein